MRCAIWYHLYSLKNVENILKLQAKKPASLLKATLLHACFSRFYTVQLVQNRAKTSTNWCLNSLVVVKTKTNQFTS